MKKIMEINKSMIATWLACLLSTCCLTANAESFNGYDASSDKNLWRQAAPQVKVDTTLFSVEDIENGFLIRSKKDCSDENTLIWIDTALGKEDFTSEEQYDFSCHFESSASLDRIQLYFACINNRWGDEILFNTLTYIESGKDNVFYSSQRCRIGGYDAQQCFFAISPTIISIPANTELKITDICLIKHSDNTIEVPEKSCVFYQPFEQDGSRFDILSYAKREVSIQNIEPRQGMYAIPSSVQYDDTDYTITEVSESAFANQDLTSLIIPASIKSIGQYAFRNCSSLREVHVMNPEAPAVDYGAFALVPTNHTMLYVPVGSKDNYAYSPVWCDFVNIVEIDEPLAISAVNAARATDAKSYTLDGKITDATSATGLRIVDGRVVLIK